MVDRACLASDGAGAPITFTQCLWRSDPGAWAGFPLEMHRIGPQGTLRDFDVPDILLGTCVAGSAQMEFGAGTRARRALMQPGAYVLLDRGSSQQPIRWSGLRETLYVRLQAERLQRLAPDLADGAHATPRYAVADPHVQHLALSMLEEARLGAPHGALYADGLSLALLAYLLAPVGETPLARRSGRLPQAKAAAVRDYVTAHLSSDIALVDLARIAGFSAHHFAMLFKSTFGDTPHRYVLAQRVDAARRLLREDGLSISDVALALGFADQSHFTAIFRKATGTTPKRFRESH
jgi:AraC family transcriptional regulator